MNGARILLIEDEPALARGLSDTLRTNGFDVTVVADGALGLDAAVGGSADLILLDVMLPKVNGYEICRTVRAQGLEVPILMLTAKGQEQEVQHLAETSDLSPNQARELLRRHGNDWPKLKEAAKIFKAES